MRILILISIVILAAVPLSAGVVLKMASRDSSGNELEDNTILVQSERIRIDNVGGGGGQMSMIFRGEDLVTINIPEKEYYVLDEATIEKMGSQISDAMKMLEEQMAKASPEQRAMMERMMKGQLESMGMGNAQKPPAPRVEEGAAGSWESYSCRWYSVYLGEEKTQEVCAASLDQIEGIQEMQDAFGRMAEFLQKMTEAFSSGPMANIGQTPMDLIEKIDGYPVHTRIFNDGELAREVFLKSAHSEDLDPSTFEPPEGFQERQLVPEN